MHAAAATIEIHAQFSVLNPHCPYRLHRRYAHPSMAGNRLPSSNSHSSDGRQKLELQACTLNALVS